MKKYFLVYAIPYIILQTVLLALLLVYPKIELHILLNSYHTRLQDTFFTYYSIIAEGPIYALMLLPLLWKHFKMTLFFGISELSGGTVLQILKQLFSMPRPASAFENYPDMVLPVVEGVNLHHSNSFPSGHASTFFVFCTCCAIILAYHHRDWFRQRKASSLILTNGTLLVLLSLATLGAYSRVYLSQHFLTDVYVGSVIGFAAPCLVFYFGRRYWQSTSAASGKPFLSSRDSVREGDSAT